MAVGQRRRRADTTTCRHAAIAPARSRSPACLSWTIRDLRPAVGERYPRPVDRRAVGIGGDGDAAAAMIPRRRRPSRRRATAGETLSPRSARSPGSALRQTRATASAVADELERTPVAGIFLPTEGCVALFRGAGEEHRHEVWGSAPSYSASAMPPLRGSVRTLRAMRANARPHRPRTEDRRRRRSAELVSAGAIAVSAVPCSAGRRRRGGRGWAG